MVSFTINVLKFRHLLPVLLTIIVGLTPGLATLYFLLRCTIPTDAECSRTNGYLNVNTSRTPDTTIHALERTFSSTGEYVNSILSTSPLWSINIVFGNYSLSSVKFIDAAWDLGVGRGGQILLGLMWYLVAADTIVAAMEVSAMPTRLFRAVTISGSHGWTFLHALHAICLRRAGKRTLLIVGLVFGSLWVLAWPTIMSLLTGYVSLTEPYFKLHGDSLVPYKSFLGGKKRALVIHDGHRIGLKRDVTLHEDVGNIYLAIDYCLFPFQYMSHSLGLL